MKPIRSCVPAVLTFVFLALPALAAEEQRSRPNIIVVFCDNLGYGDVGCFGSTLHRTPNIDRLAEEGRKFTDFYAVSGVCTPSRAGLMTGCYPRRVNLHVDKQGGAVLRPVSPKGLHPDEITIAEVLKKAGYATAIIGKWHLGDQICFLPTRQGFDYWLGIPYSDDMTPRASHPLWPPLPLMENETVIDAPVDCSTLTERYTKKAIEWIEAHRDGPFFLYLPHATPGSTRAPEVAERFRGRSKNGPWGDSVEELDWSTGQIMEALERLGLEQNTLIVWTSDNGAPRREPSQGRNEPLSGWGYSTAEGGMRVPCIVRWPTRVPAGTICREPCLTIDLLPTFAELAGTHPPADRIIDGRDIGPLFFGAPGAASPHEAIYYYHQEQLQAVRSGPWKLYLPLNEKQELGATANAPTPARLFHLIDDLDETKDLASERPDVVRRLCAFAAAAREDLGDAGQPGKNQRAAGWVENPTPRVLPEK